MATQADLDSLLAAIAEGSLEVQSAGRRVVYRSLDEMLRIASMLESEVNGTTRKSSDCRRYFSFRRD